MAGRDNQRAGGGVLPNLVTPDGVDVQVARKRHYLAELQSQADADRARKAADRPGRGGGGGAPQYPSPLRNRNQGPSPPPFGAFLGAPQFAHAERGNDFAARLKQGFEAALQQAQVQVAGGAERYPDGPQPGGRDQGAEIMSAMRRWEAMFTGQVSASIQAISELNAHVVLLEEQISAHGREKQLLRERVEQAEMAQKELQLAKLETETSLREIVRNEQDKGRRLQQELSGLRESVDELSQQQASARVQAERVSDDLRDRQQRHSSASGSLDERVQTLEAKLAEASDTIAALRDKEAEESRRHSRALADASETMAQVISRVKQVEERVVPDVQRYVDKSNQEFWTPSQTEISELRRRIELLSSRIDEVDTTASSLIITQRDAAAQDRVAARDERVTQANGNLSRFRLVDKALSEEKDERLAGEAKLRREVESMAKAVSLSFRDADAQHAALVEAVHARVVERIAKQGQLASAVQEALENKRAFLEEVVRAEIGSRFAAMEELKAFMLVREDEGKKELVALKQGFDAQMKLLLVKVEAAQRTAEAVRQDMEAELLSMDKKGSQAEEAIRASLKTQAGDINLQLSGLREMVQGMTGLGSETQEDRDLDQDEKIEKLRTALSQANARIDSLSDHGEHDRGRLHKALLDFKSEYGVYKEDVETKLAALGIAAEALRENFQSRLESTDQHVQDVRVQVIDVIKDLHEGPEALFHEAQKGIHGCRAEMDVLRQALEDRCRQVQEASSSTCQELATQLETAQSRAALMQQQVRAEQARLDQADKAVRALFETHVREIKIWKEDSDARIQTNHETALRVREVFARELREIQGAMASTQHGQDLKWQQMDSKLTDDARKMLQAMQSFRVAHEQLKASTDEHFAQLLAEEEKNLTRVWTDIEANRARCDKHFDKHRELMGEEEHERKEAVAALHSLIDDLKQELVDARKTLSDAVEHEASMRANADNMLQDATNALREDTKEADHELGRKIEQLKDQTEQAVLGVQENAKAANAEHEQRSAKNLEFIQSLETTLAGLDDDYRGTVARLADVQETSVAQHARLEEALDKTGGALRQEHLERQAAVTEVYVRMQVARETDSLMRQVAESALHQAVREVRAEVQKSGEAAEMGVNERVQALSVHIAQLKEEDASTKSHVSKLETAATKSTEELRAACQALSKQVEETQASVVLKSSQMQDQVRDSSSQMQTELQKMQALVSSTTEQLKTQASQDLQRLDGVVAAERNERVKSMEEKSAEWEAALKKASEDWQASGAQEKERREAAAALLSQRVEDLESKERELATGAEKSGADAAVKLQALDDKHKALLEILAATKGELEEKLGASKSELEEKLAAEQQKQEGDLQALETKLNEKIDGGSAASSKEIGEKVEQMGQRVEELGGKVEEHAAKIVELEESKASAGKLESDMHEVSLLRERVVAMEAKTSALDTDALSQKIEAVDAKITALEGSYVKIDTLDAALNENQNVVDLELKPLKSQMAELASKITILEGSGGVSEEAVAALQCIQKLQQDLSELDAERQRNELQALSTDVDTKVEALRTRIVPLEEMAEKNAGNAAGAAQLAEVKEALEKDFKDTVSKVEENLNFRLDQMKIDELSKKVGELTALGNVNSQTINGLDKKVNEMKEIIAELVDDEAPK